jgi:inner membrane protein
MLESSGGARPRLFSPLLVKAVTIGVLLIVMLVALAQVRSLVYERTGARDQAVQRVRETLGGAQTVGGVVLSVPFVSTYKVGERTEQTRSVAYVLPDTLETQVTWELDLRSVGLYRVPAFVATVEVNGVIAARDLRDLRSAKADRVVSFEETMLTVLNSESRTLRAFEEFTIGAAAAAGEPRGYAGFAGVAGRVSVSLITGNGDIPFRARYQLVGSESLSVLPLARSAKIRMSSPWPHPKFVGGQAPVKQEVGPDGFLAEWNTLDLARSFGQSWIGDEVRPGSAARDAFCNAALGVEQYEPVNVYQRNHRAVYYAMLVIGITFLTFFLVEHVGRMPIHAMQYLFVGLALAVFYVLLLALSEHVPFWVAYVAAAGALVVLITAYLAGVLKSVGRALVAGAALAALYALLYLILVSEDYSLLMGALLLFAALATLMLLTRRFDWSSVGSSRSAGSTTA